MLFDTGGIVVWITVNFLLYSPLPAAIMRGMKRRMWLTGLLVFAGLAAGLTGWSLYRAPLPEVAAAKAEAPRRMSGADFLTRAAPGHAFTLLEKPGESQGPQDWVGRGGAFINFFASWCAPCRAEHPVLMDLRKATALPVIGIAHYDRTPEARKMLAELGDPYTLTLEDATGRGGKQWGLNGIPESFILDGKGVVVWNHRGPITPALLQEAILPLLQRLEAQAGAGASP